ncbi:MAG: SH3 domain-containing protein [uncultured Sulfurovum sp.]|uniref:SH3 domain-containing protein n=1 Tax=uncultured Sulfurovum sp. TaxID=269237 RepID=A0A6S6S977_9BACT|nr:MAG: SH3 domain-containing protein [uncultured Sulfurovum sp.]
MLTNRTLHLQSMAKGIQKKYAYAPAENINVNLENKAKKLFTKLNLPYEKIPTLRHNEKLPSKIEGMYQKDKLSLRKNPRVSDKKAESVAMHEIYHHTQKDKGLELGQEEAQANKIEKAYLNENQERQEALDFDLIYAHTIKQFYEHEELEQLVRTLGGDASSARRVYANAMEVIAEAKNQKKNSNLVSQNVKQVRKVVGDSGVKYKKSENKFSTSKVYGPHLPESEFIGPIRPTVDYGLLQSKVKQNSSSFPFEKIEKDTSVLQSVPTLINQSILPTIENNIEPKVSSIKISKMGIVWNKEGVNVRSRPNADSDSKTGVRLPFNTHLFVFSKEEGYYSIRTNNGEEGYVSAEDRFVNLRLPEPNAKLHFIESGDTSLSISHAYYGGQAQWGQDHRFFVAGLIKVNQGKGQRGIYCTDGQDWSKAEVISGYMIWIPSLAYMKALSVASGSLSYDTTQVIKGIAHWTKEQIEGLLSGIYSTCASVGNWIWGVLLGEFNPNPSVDQILADVGIGFIPILGQIADARDLIAIAIKLSDKEERANVVTWISLVAIIIGVVPGAGDVVKGVIKIIMKKGADVLQALQKFLSDNGIQDISGFLNKIDWKAHASKASTLLANVVNAIGQKLQEVLKAVALVMAKVKGLISDDVVKFVNIFKAYLLNAFSKLKALESAIGAKISEAFTALSQQIDEAIHLMLLLPPPNKLEPAYANGSKYTDELRPPSSIVNKIEGNSNSRETAGRQNGQETKKEEIKRLENEFLVKKGNLDGEFSKELEEIKGIKTFEGSLDKGVTAEELPKGYTVDSEGVVLGPNNGRIIDMMSRDEKGNRIYRGEGHSTYFTLEDGKRTGSSSPNKDDNIRAKENMIKGKYGEDMMDAHFIKLGYRKINKKSNASDKGIDGIYVKDGPPKEYVVVEAKFGSSELTTVYKPPKGETPDGRKNNEVYKEFKERFGRPNQKLDNIPEVDKKDYEEYQKLHDSRELKYKQMNEGWITKRLEDAGLSSEDLKNIKKGYTPILMKVPDPTRPNTGAKAIKLDEYANASGEFIL